MSNKNSEIYLHRIAKLTLAMRMPANLVARVSHAVMSITYCGPVKFIGL
jgi:hypothetical protein